MQLRYFLIPLLFTSCVISKNGTGSDQKDKLNTENEDEINHVNIVYDVSRSKFISKPQFIREGASVGLSWENVNPWAVKSNPVFANINADYSTGTDEAQAGLVKLIAANSDNDSTKSDVINGKTGDPKSKAEEYVKTKSGFLKKIEHNFSNLLNQTRRIEAIMAMDTILKLSMDNPNLTKLDIKEALFGPTRPYGISEAKDIPGVMKITLEEIAKVAAENTAEIDKLKSFTDAFAVNLTDEEKAANNKLYDELKKQNDKVKESYSNNSKLIANAAIIQTNIQKVLAVPFNVPARVVGFANGDYFEFSDELKDSKGNVVYTIKPQRIKTFGGARVNTSVGIAVNIGGNGEEFVLRKNPDNVTSGPDTAKVVLVRNGENTLLKFSPVINAHWYKTTKSSIQWMFTLGLAPDFSTLGDSRIFVGTSLGFPSSIELTRRLVISGGLSVGYANTLKTEYKGMENLARFGEVEPDDLTTRAPRLGGFISVSFNLSNIRTSN